MREHFEKMGELIYGMHRIDGVIASMDLWMAGKGLDEEDQTQVGYNEKFLARVAESKRFFLRSNLGDDVCTKHRKMLAEVRDLEMEVGDVANVAAALLPDLLRKMRIAHVHVADVMEYVGFNPQAAKGLRERGERIILA